MPPGGHRANTVLRMEEKAERIGPGGICPEEGEKAFPGGEVGGGESASEGGDRGDHGGEPGAKKGALGIEDHGQLPAALQKEVHTTVEQSKKRSGWPAKKTLA